MMRFSLLLAGFLMILEACNRQDETNYLTDPAELVNPFMGTGSEVSLSNGITHPAIARHWGMNFRVPQINQMGNGWMYQYHAYKIRGFRQIQQPGLWINDYGLLSMFATNGQPVSHEDKRVSWFSHPDNSYLTHEELLKGGRLIFAIGSEPEKSIWSIPESFSSSVTQITE